MSLVDALSQLAIFGATSIVLWDGRSVALEDADGLVDRHAGRHFRLSATGMGVEIVEVASGRLFARAVTLWRMRVRPRRRWRLGDSSHL